MPTDTAIFPESELNACQSRLESLGLEPSQDVLIADIGEKKLHLIRRGALLRSYTVSSGVRPRSCKADSRGTPWGLHQVCAKYGQGEPAGTIFKARKSTGKRWQDHPGSASGHQCLVTTRILRLCGLEPGMNAGEGVDSHDRYIYIHGTNHPDRFPDNISAGCLNMLDNDLIELFDLVDVGTVIWLSQPRATGPDPGELPKQGC